MAATWSPSKKRFGQLRKNETPGPGVYNPTDYNNGLYVLSNFKNRGTPHMLKPTRPNNSQLVKRNETPGPGTYMPPSDFGYLELYKFSPRTSQGMRSVMDQSAMYRTEQKFNNVRGVSQNSTRANTTIKTRNNGRTNSMIDHYPEMTPTNEREVP